MLMTGYDQRRNPSGLRGWNIVCAFFMAMLIVAAYPASIQAHPPKNLVLSYDAQKQILSVTITHSSFFPTKHYIKGVEISVNGKVVKNSNYSEQPSADTFTFTYAVGASAGDEISAVVKCNMFGSTDASIKAPEK